MAKVDLPNLPIELRNALALEVDNVDSGGVSGIGTGGKLSKWSGVGPSLSLTDSSHILENAGGVLIDTTSGVLDVNLSSGENIFLSAITGTGLISANGKSWAFTATVGGGTFGGVGNVGISSSAGKVTISQGASILADFTTSKHVILSNLTTGGFVAVGSLTGALGKFSVRTAAEPAISVDTSAALVRSVFTYRSGSVSKWHTGTDPSDDSFFIEADGGSQYLLINPLTDVATLQDSGGNFLTLDGGVGSISLTAASTLGITSLSTINMTATDPAGGTITLQDTFSSASIVIDGVADSITLTSTNFGAFGAPPVPQPTVVGLKGGNAALGSLLTALSDLGWIIDSSGA